MKLNNSPKNLLLATAVTAALMGCAINPETGQPEITSSVSSGFKNIFNNSNPCSNNDRNIGILAGALAGTVAAHFLGKKGAALVAGGVIGGVAGGLIGHSMDQRRCNLYRIAQRYKLRMAVEKITPQRLGESSSENSSRKNVVGLNVQLVNKGDEFIPGTARLTSEARVYLGRIAEQYTPSAFAASLGRNATPQQREQVMHYEVLIVGHTDQRDNLPGVDLARLSYERAHAVARIFVGNGVLARNLEIQGAGDTLPIASNANPQGRHDNNRVQIVDVQNIQTLKRFLVHRKANPAYFSTTPTKSTQPVNIHQPNEKIAAMHPTKLKHAKTEAVSWLGLQGAPGATYHIDLGASQNHSLRSSIPFISSAFAAERPLVVNSCLKSHPRTATEIRNYSTGQVLHLRNIKDMLPGLYGQPWVGTQHRAGIALLHVYVPRDAGAPVPPVTVEFYRREKSGLSKRPIAIYRHSPVNIYRGSRATLYRVFLHGSVQCMDLYVPKGSPESKGLIVFPVHGEEYKALGTFHSEG